MFKYYNLKLPLVLACCGCAKNAKIANNVAQVMDSEGFAQLLHTVVTAVYPEPLWVKQVRAGRAIMLLDGCHKCCTLQLLKTYKINASWHINLLDYGLVPDNDGLHTLSKLNIVMRKVQGILSAQQV